MIKVSIMESIGKEIKEIIRKKGISRYRVSKDLGIAQESLLRSLKDGANPRWETVRKVLEYLGYEIRLVEKKEGKRQGKRYVREDH
jgi:probable addiction module antidote protein